MHYSEAMEEHSDLRLQTWGFVELDRYRDCLQNDKIVDKCVCR